MPLPQMIDETPPTFESAEPVHRQLVRLRFKAPLESVFRREYEASAPASRVTLLLLATILIAVTPLYDVSLLHAPAEFLKSARILQFGVEIPVVLLSLLLTAYKPLKHLSAAATILAAMVVAGGIMAQRMLAAPYGFHVPHDFPAIAFTTTLFLARLRLFYVLPWGVLTMIGATVADLHTFQSSDVIYGIVSSWMLFTIAVTGTYLLEYSARQSWYRGRLLEFQALRDGLTGMLNRRHFDLELRQLIRDAARQRKNVALLILDIDHFKAYNDHYGHPLGDECLRRVGQRLQLAMRRPRDFCARIGGEEFAAVWFDACSEQSAVLAEELRLMVQELGIAAAPASGANVTASGGFVQVLAPSPADTAERVAADMMKRGDAALYAAKRAGRARMIVAKADAFVELQNRRAFR